jgi:hypothetical protein
VALVTGYQQLAWLVALLYVAAYGAATWFPRLADRDLARQHRPGARRADAEPAVVTASPGATIEP